MYRRMTVLATGALAALVAMPTATAAPDSSNGGAADPRPTAQARAAGITQPGEAMMGWRMQDSGTAPAKVPTSELAGSVPGIDVSGHQGNVDWAGQWGLGKRFAYVKATESTGYVNPYFTQQYTGSYNTGMIRGAYHFALPDRSSGAAQANYFVDNGGGWSADGKTLPGALDMEWNPYGATCFGKSQADMRTWIGDFVATYKARTGRAPAIYTATSWWNQCVGDYPGIGADVPLWLARYADAPGAVPNGFSTHTFWQYSDKPIDQNVFNGSYDRLEVFARG